MLQYDEKSSLVGTFRYPFFGRDYFRTTLYENDLLGRSLVDSFFRNNTSALHSSLTAL